MGSKLSTKIAVGVMVSFFLSAAVVLSADDPRTRIDFWQKNYRELLPGESERAARAHEIFHRVLTSAGKRLGVVPRLFIIKNKAPNIPLAIALPDGGIIITKRVIDICYTDAELGDDRLAFVLAHEIAHQLKDDFWHLKFFQAVELSRMENLKNKKVLDEIKDIARKSDKVLFKELQADEHGITYASMAGFKTNAIITEDNRVNFFEYFYESLDPGNIRGFHKDDTHPTPKQRAEAVKARLLQVLEKVELFNLGLNYYQTGQYGRAILFFREFLRFFPSREVYHNLATSYHQSALKFFQEMKKKDDALPFKLSITVDPETRANKILLKRGNINDPAQLFKEHLGKAVEYYKTAISHDPSYHLSYNNLGCALILNGDIYEAIANLKKTIKLKPDYTPAFNNLGVAFFMAENEKKARENLLKANALNPAYNASFFNLGNIAYKNGNMKEARIHWLIFLKLDGKSAWADSVRKLLSSKASATPSTVSHPGKIENILGLEIMDYEDSIPGSWGKPVKRQRIDAEEEPFWLSRYENGVKTLSQSDEFQLILATGDYRGKSTRGISVGSSQKEVLAKYGQPARILNLAQTNSWVYTDQGIAFLLKKGKVISWLLFK